MHTCVLRRHQYIWLFTACGSALQPISKKRCIACNKICNLVSYGVIVQIINYVLDVITFHIKQGQNVEKFVKISKLLSTFDKKLHWIKLRYFVFLINHSPSPWRSKNISHALKSILERALAKMLNKWLFTRSNLKWQNVTNIF